MNAWAAYLRCPECGGSLPITPERPKLICRYCGRHTEVEHAGLDRLRAHLRVLDDLIRHAKLSAWRADLKAGQHKVMRILPPVVIGVAIFAKSTDRMWLIPVLMAVTLLAVFGVAAVMTRRRVALEAASVARRISDVLCSQCGASLPVLEGSRVACPFCRADLIPPAAALDETEARMVERIGHEQAREAREQAAAAAIRDRWRGYYDLGLRIVIFGGLGILALLFALGALLGWLAPLLERVLR